MTAPRYTPGEIIRRREGAREAAQHTRVTLRTYLIVMAQRMQEHLELMNEIDRSDRVSMEAVGTLLAELCTTKELLERISLFADSGFEKAHRQNAFFETLAATVRIDEVA